MSERPSCVPQSLNTHAQSLDDVTSISSGGAGQPEANRRSDRQRQPRRLACKECRQAKLRCDLQNGVSSCGRCRRMRLECQVDTHFKRVKKRLKIEELVDELEHLRSIVSDKGPLNDSRRSVSSSHDRTVDGFSGALSRPEPLPINDASAAYEQSNLGQATSIQTPTLPTPNSEDPVHRLIQSEPPPPVWNCATRSLEHLSLASNQINQLFRVFFEYQHHFIEILDPSISPDEYFTRSSLLFWAIISVASRRYEEDGTLLSSLEPAVMRLVWKTIAILPHSGFTVQALLLLSFWSFPTNSMSTDPAFLLVSIAKTSAMQLGLHRPETVQDFLRVKTQLGPAAFRDAVRTWWGCNIVAESTTSTIGQLSLFSDDLVSDYNWDVGNNFVVSDNLRIHLIFQKFVGRFHRAMADNLRSAQPDQSIIKLLEDELGDMERMSKTSFTAAHHICLQIACMQLRTYYFLFNSTSTLRREGLLKAYQTALILINKFSDADSNFDFMKYAPDFYSQNLSIAANVVLRIVNSSYSKYIDQEGGKRAFNAVLSLLRRASVENNDLRGRASKILSQLWSLYQSRLHAKDQEPILRVRTRFAASVLHDSLWTWREELWNLTYTVPQSTASQSPPSIDAFTGSMGPDGQRTSEPDVGNQPLNYTSGGFSGGFSGGYAVDGIIDVPNEQLTDLLPDVDWLWDIGFPTLPIDNVFIGLYS